MPITKEKLVETIKSINADGTLNHKALEEATEYLALEMKNKSPIGRAAQYILDSDKTRDDKKGLSLRGFLEDVKSCVNYTNRYAGNNPLCQAISLDDLEAATFLIEIGADVNIPNNNKEKKTPLMIAVERGKIKKTQLLIQNETNTEGLDSEINAPIKKDATQHLPETPSPSPAPSEAAEAAQNLGNTR